MYAAYKCDLRRMQPSVWETAYVNEWITESFIQLIHSKADSFNK